MTSGVMQAPTSILVCALGGEGGGVLAEWLVDVATRCGHAAQGTSIPGVAQRTGATTYYVEVARETDRAPVFSLYPVPGALDVLVASELLEAARQVSLGFVSRDRTRVIASSERTLTTHEKMQLADGRAQDGPLERVLRDHSATLDTFPMSQEASRARTALSAVMLGAIAGSGALPFAREAYEATIRASGVGVDASLAGFAAGYARVRGESTQGRASPAAAALALPPDVAARFAPAVHAMLAHGHARLVEYQDRAYAKLYVERVARVAAAERAADPGARHGHAATREAARFIASWMAFDDIVRVADLKTRRERFDRIRREVRAEARDVVRVRDHFKPGVPELAALLPSRMAAMLVRWDRRRVDARRQPLAIALKVPTHAIAGFAAMRLLAMLKPLRRRSSRFAAEQSAIEAWIGAIEQGLRRDWRIGHELALCGRLVKGYGATNERGRENLAHIVAHLAASADAIRDAREAALADDAGLTLDRALAAHGAPARPVRAQPIVWVRNARKAA
jgi:indolepyruvate ferredoxin oxidoreductase beta subunit